VTVDILPVPRGFSFELTVRSHGWFDLPPFRFDRATRTLDLPLARDGGRPPVTASVRAEAPATSVTSGKRALRVEWHGETAGDVDAARDALRSVLRLGEDLAPFHRHVARDPARRWIATRGAGRLLRTPTVFEDLVKLVLTTNCSWALTRKMTAALVERCGEPAPLGLKTFPDARRLARRDAAFFRDAVRAGYRSPFLAGLARRVASGAIDPESWRDPSRPTE